jgi:hypothetical protein
MPMINLTHCGHKKCMRNRHLISTSNTVLADHYASFATKRGAASESFEPLRVDAEFSDQHSPHSIQAERAGRA